MKTAPLILRTVLFVLTAASSQLGFAKGTPSTSQVLYPAESQQSFSGPDKYFTGAVQVQMLFPVNETASYSGAYVTFAPGARTAWHTHPAGQHMIVTRGMALTGTRDGKILEFAEGETVWCPPDIDHWHGATPNLAMTHLVITGSRDSQNVIWKEKVSDKEYLGAIGQRTKNAPPVPSSLTLKQHRIIPIAAFTANGDVTALKSALEKGLDDGLSVNEIKEVQIHLYAYVGFPRALNGLATFMTVLNERKAKGVKDDIGPEPSLLPVGRSSLEVGREVQTRLVGRPVSGPLFDFAPAINTLLQGHLFGDLFGRGVLDYQGREIATLSALASIDGVDSQLRAHVSIAGNVGLTKTQLEALATVLGQTVGLKEGSRAEQAVKQVLRPEDDEA